ncbi:magnesium transporter CorA family protein [Clostridium tyrobutyricum]|uniref:magnesium transporter CorA family protein n=1 Tax=Clostridium tyrobutyricum TaxID=1519 RepID=UPI001C3855C6|nr:magnesium transporter CorA family protein [Clostridium tyrobutyricum]MBV4418135.1 magnesium transporter CorA family protein [Clostridium tyrobutyricum]
MRIIDIDNNFINVDCEEDLKDNKCWIMADVSEVESLNKFINIDNESIEDCKSFSQTSKISFFNEYIFVIFNVLSWQNDIVTSKDLNVFLSKNYIITVYRDSMGILNNLIDDIRDSKNCYALKDKPAVDMLLYYILDRIIIRNYDVISKLEASADKIEINILKDAEKEQLYHLITLRRQVYKVRKYLNPLRYIGDSLSLNDNLIIETENIAYFIGLNKKIEKLMLSLESLVQDLALVREAFESETANKTNELMKIFTVITSVFLPLNLITSMYGMNLKGIPFIELENGCHYVVIFMICIAIFLIFIFKRNKWI